MADRMLFMGWKEPVRGREARALEVFEEAVGILGRKQQEGAIEKFDVVLLSPNGRMDGYIQVEGTSEQITALREDEDFLRNTTDATLAVDGITHIEGYVNDGISRMMGMYQERIGAVPQHA
jgi:hypothetical protein